MKKLVIDIDGTLTSADSTDYESVGLNMAVAEQLRQYKEAGFEIALHTARNMRTYENNTGKINAKTLSTLADCLTCAPHLHREIA